MKPDRHDDDRCDAPEPLSRWLEPAIDEARIARAWQHLRSAQGSPAPRRSWRWLLAPAGLLATSAALWLLWLRPTPGNEALRAVDERLSFAPGSEVNYVPDVIPLRDGSRVILEPAAQLQVLENDGQRFVAQLRRGTARLAVAPGPRRWTIETELATVEVIGAVVTIAHHEHVVQVSVLRGVVMVRGERVPGRVARLVDGQQLEVLAEPAALAPESAALAPEPAALAPESAGAPTAAAATPALPSPPAPKAAPASPPQVRKASPPAASAARPASEPRSLLDAAPAEAPRATPAGHADPAAPAAPVAPAAAPSTAKAMRDADQLRRAGDAAAAAALLEDARRQRPDDPAGGMLEYSLGRLYLNQLGDPGRAARVFSAVIARGAPQPLIEGAMALRCEALWRSGDRQAARAALEQYQRRYPAGSRLAELTALLAQQ